MMSDYQPKHSGAEHRPHVAVIGGGISGMGAALRLSDAARVTMYERSPLLGGHADTQAVVGDAGVVDIDTGFIVYNERTYPHLTELFARLDVATKPAPMTFSVCCDECGLQFAGGSVLQLLSSLVRHRSAAPLLAGIVRFRRAASHALDAGELDPDITLAAWTELHGVSELVRTHYVVPLTAAVWSTPPGQALDMPAATTLEFLDNHGLVRGTPPQWRTVVGGSRTYVGAVARELRARGVLLASDRTVTRVERTSNGCRVHDTSGTALEFDHVVFATHPDTTLELLAGPTMLERELLAAFEYTPNEVVLHEDPRVLPRRRVHWAAWNYRLATCSADSGPTRLTYQMDILQSLGGSVPYCTTVNALDDEIEPARIHARLAYAHPRFDADALRAQRRMGELASAGARTHTWHCGAWQGHGFHEDGLRSGYAAADALIASNADARAVPDAR